MTNFTREYLAASIAMAEALKIETIEAMVETLSHVRANHGRLFVLGIGGSAANASHATADFRKMCDLEAYCPVDNAAELTARVNDEGWESVFEAWLRVSRLRANDALLVLSVGGGDASRGVSANLITAIDLAKSAGAATLAIAGRREGYAARVCDTVLVVGSEDSPFLTPIAESFQSLVLHALVFHPALRNRTGRWEELRAE